MKWTIGIQIRAPCHIFYYQNGEDMVLTAMEAENFREEGGEGNGDNTANCNRAMTP